MEETEFINLYIQNLVTQVTELTKTKILQDTRINFKDRELEELRKRTKEAEESIVKEKDEVAQTWKLALDEKNQEISNIQTSISDMRRKHQLEISDLQVRLDTAQRDLSIKDRDLAAKDFEIKALKKDIEDAKVVILDVEEVKVNSKSTPDKKGKTKVARAAST